MRTGVRRAIRLAGLAILALLVVSLAGARAVNADDDDAFFGSSPGDLSASHAALDNKDHCNDCHTGNREVSNQKCLGCHDHQNLAGRISAGKGFHASSIVSGKECKSCHQEHKGKAYDIMGWKSVKGGQTQFDHDITGWQLHGKHATTKCEDCHKARDKQGLRTFMGNDRACGACHNKDQPHKFVRKDMLQCERCHGESVWKPAKQNMQFNHDDRKDALMPLLGAHRDVSCEKCHAKSVFKLPFAKADNCGNAGCHQSPHAGHLFNKRECEWCHSPTFKTLKEFRFDHSEKTKFELGAHSKLDCYACHTKAIGEAKPQANCEGCHAKDSHHGDRFKEFGTPPKCGFCHPSTSWKPTVFNHAKGGKWQLTGKHAEIACRACHRGKQPGDFEEFKTTICMDCHQHKNVHDGKWKSSECLRCHNGAGMIGVKEGELTRVYHGPNSLFPLVKAHKTVPCAECHTGRDEKGKTSFSKESTQCGDRCHEDSLHKGTLGKDCNRCHSSGTWDALKFSHDTQTHHDNLPDWPLKGEHKKNKCEDCHAKRQFADTPRNCSADGCHAQDDAHKGRLGDKCEQCHVETGDNIFNHNTMAKFRLDGKHLTVRCADCHPSITFKPRPTTCFGCHPEPAVHRGQYGTACEQCHTTRTFDDVKPLHDVGDFSLKGGHDNIACERCHRDNRPLAGSGNLCINCHRQDDIHGNSLSPRCGECHTQWSFAPARFDHAKVGCNLTALHRTLACADCHIAGNYSGLSPQCVACHHQDALRAKNQLYSAHSTTQTCANCHSPNSWAGAVQPTGSPTMFGRESVCR